MSILPTQLINKQTNLISLVSKRQEAIADNIANMHTIGYKRKDVDFSQYLNTGSASSLETKMVEKFGASPISSSSSATEEMSVDDELSLMQQNYLYFAMASRELSSTITEIKTAMNVSSNG